MAKNLKVQLEDLNKPVSQTELLETLRVKLLDDNPELQKKITKADIKEFYTKFTEVVGEYVQQGRRVSIKDIGTLGTRFRGVRTFRNPFTQETKDSVETTVLTFTTSKSLKQSLAENKGLIKAHKEFASKKAKAKK